MSEATQARFAKALLDVEQPTPDGLTAWTARHPDRRFAIYRNNIGLGLVRVLAARFPAAERIVGSEFFAAMAKAYVNRHPPRSPLLFEYGDDLADFVARFEPAAALAYLPDVMRLEAARIKAYHAADEVPMDPGVFAALQPDDLPGLRLTLHASASVIRSTHPVVTIWAMNTGEATAELIDDWTVEEALVIRPALSVLVHRLPAGAGIFLEALQTGAPLGGAVEAALEVQPAFDLAATLACALQAGLFTALTK